MLKWVEKLSVEINVVLSESVLKLKCFWWVIKISGAIVIIRKIKMGFIVMIFIIMFEIIVLKIDQIMGLMNVGFWIINEGCWLMSMEMMQMQCEMLWEWGCMKMGIVVIDYRMELIDIEWDS